MTTPVCWSAQVGDLNNNYTSNVEIVLPNIDAMKIVMLNFHMDDPQCTHRYNIILGFNKLSKLNKDLCFSDNKLRGNGGTYEGYTNPTEECLKTIQPVIRLG